jgi:LPS export ABC transporter protein LptC
VVLVGVLFSCENDVNEIAKYDLSERFPDQSVQDVEILYSTEGEVAFQLKAPLLNQYSGEEPYNEMPDGVHVQFFDSTQKVTTDLTANYAIHYTKQNEERMLAEGNVIVTNDKGERLNTEKLLWSKKTQQITSDVFVKITTENQVLMGDGLVANQDFTDYRILKPRGILNIEND